MHCSLAETGIYRKGKNHSEFVRGNGVLPFSEDFAEILEGM
jgi:hypothetical protein